MNLHTHSSTHPVQLLPDAGDLLQLAFGNKLEDGIEDRAQHRNIQPRGVIGHVETGPIGHQRLPRDDGKRVGQCQPHFGPDFARCVKDGSIGIPFLVPFADHADRSHGGHPKGAREQRNSGAPETKGIHHFFLFALSQSNQGLAVLLGQEENLPILFLLLLLQRRRR